MLKIILLCPLHFDLCESLIGILKCGNTHYNIPRKLSPATSEINKQNQEALNIQSYWIHLKEIDKHCCKVIKQKNYLSQKLHHKREGWAKCGKCKHQQMNFNVF